MFQEIHSGKLRVKFRLKFVFKKKCLKIYFCALCSHWPDHNIGCCLIFWANDSFLQNFCLETSAGDINFNSSAPWYSPYCISPKFSYSHHLSVPLKKSLFPEVHTVNWKMPHFRENVLFSVNIYFSFWKNPKQLILYKTDISTFKIFLILFMLYGDEYHFGWRRLKQAVSVLECKKKSVDKRSDIFNKMRYSVKILPHFSSQISDGIFFFFLRQL